MGVQENQLHSVDEAVDVASKGIGENSFGVPNGPNFENVGIVARFEVDDALCICLISLALV